MTTLAPTSASHRECELCTYEMIHPEDDQREPVFIFPSVQGIMIRNQDAPHVRKQIRATLKKIYPDVSDPTNYHHSVATAKHFNPSALDNLHDLIQKIESAGYRALVVLASGWGTTATLEQFREVFFNDYLFGSHLCGKIGGFSYRNKVILDWLKNHGLELNSTKLLVIDHTDLHMTETFGEKFIHAQGEVLQAKHVEQGLEALGISAQRV